MKIYSKCIYAWQPDGSLKLEEAESFDYEGPVSLCKDSPSPPPAPDYPAAAQATSQGSVQAAIANNLLNMRNTSTPLGSQTFTPSGTFDIPSVGGQPGFQIPQFSQNISMTPEGQGLYNQQMGLSKGLLGLGQGSLDQTRASLGGAQDLSTIGQVANQAYAAQTSRLDPQWNERAEQYRTMLANQGLAPGGEAYDAAQRNFNQSRNDAYTQARLAAIQTMPQTYQLSTAQRMQPLTELNAIRTGAQPQMPQFQGLPGAGGAQGPNMLGAAQAQYGAGLDQYNAGVGADNAFMSGLFQLGGALGGPAIMKWSDRRLKRDIAKVFDDPRGFGWYSFRYLWNDRPMIGVMAQELIDVIPEAVVTLPSGYMAVRYDMIGGVKNANA